MLTPARIENVFLYLTIIDSGVGVGHLEKVSERLVY